MNKEIWIKNMLEHVLNILNEEYGNACKYDLSIDKDTFNDMKCNIEEIIKEVISEI